MDQGQQAQQTAQAPAQPPAKAPKKQRAAAPAKRKKAPERRGPEVFTFSYEMTTLNGRRQKGKIRATSEQQAAAILAEQGTELLKLRKQKKSALNIDIGSPKVKSKELIVFTRQLSTFVSSGVSMIDAFASIGSESASVALQDTLREVSIDLSEGWPLSEAMNKHPNIFPNFYVNMVRAGEVTGQLDEVLDNVASYMERNESSKKAVKAALIYPSIIGVMAILTMLVMVTFVLPRFVTFFDKLGAQLPFTTKLLLGSASFLSNNIIAVVLGVTAVCISFYAYFIRSPQGRRIFDRTLLRVPVLGDLLRYATVERFCQTMAVMVKAGVPLATSFNVVIDTSQNSEFKDGLTKVQEQMLMGYGMSRPIAQLALFPPLVPQMIRVGEDIGNLDEQLQVAADFYGKELDYKISQFTALFEPLMIIFMAGGVGFVAVALVQAMYGIYGQVDK